MANLPKKTSKARTGEEREAGKKPRRERSRKDRSPNAWTRRRLDYEALEAAKVLVESIHVKEHGKFKKEIRISLLPWSSKGYIDIRNYFSDRSTGQGILCHVDLWPQFLAGCYAADRMLDQKRKEGFFLGDDDGQR